MPIKKLNGVRQMSTRKTILLKIMYWYNIIVSGGFGIVIFVMACSPRLREQLAWNGFDPIITSLAVPLFLIISVFSIRFLRNVREGIILLKMQIVYKPVAVGLIVFYMISGKIHLAWGLIIIAGLLFYIIGNILALPDKNSTAEDIAASSGRY